MTKTRWVIRLDRREAESGLDWARDFLAHYDTAQLAEIRLSPGSSKSGGIYGRCWYPSQRSPFYRISCHVAGPFPSRIETRQPPIYRRADGSWPNIPEGCVEGLHCRAESRREISEWKRVIGFTQVENMEEGIIWIVSHEMFHFLRRTRQVPERNTEIEADRFADQQLAFVRQLKSRWTRTAKH